MNIKTNLLRNLINNATSARVRRMAMTMLDKLTHDCTSYPAALRRAWGY